MANGPGARGFLVVTLCYQAFTLSDGALRMLVLLHLQAAGQTPLALALLLMPYEAAGIFTNLLGGWLGARFGQKPVLLTGLLLQVVACLMLGTAPLWLTVPYVMATQVLSGVAKDLSKTAAKSYVRVLEPTASPGALFRAVAVVTGSKNAMKGLGFFAGGALLATAGFRSTNVVLAALLAVMFVFAAWQLPRTTGKPQKSITSMFAHDAAVNWLAAARLFLFGSRDAWFAVALPLFLTTSWGWGSTAVGGFLAAWVIGYGAVQAAAPRLLPTTDLRKGTTRAMACTFGLLAPLALTWAGLQQEQPSVWVAIGLCLYGVVFALTSSLHSWLVVAIAGAEDTAERVGFYYAANAAGRLVGTLASGWLFGMFGGGAPGLSMTVVIAAAAVICAGGTLLPTVLSRDRFALRPPGPADRKNT